MQLELTARCPSQSLGGAVGCCILKTRLKNRAFLQFHPSLKTSVGHVGQVFFTPRKSSWSIKIILKYGKKTLLFSQLEDDIVIRAKRKWDGNLGTCSTFFCFLGTDYFCFICYKEMGAFYPQDPFQVICQLGGSIRWEARCSWRETRGQSSYVTPHCLRPIISTLQRGLGETANWRMSNESLNPRKSRENVNGNLAFMVP